MMKRIHKSYFLLILVHAIVLSGCASTSQNVTTTGVDRIRPWAFDVPQTQAGPRVAFVSKGLYLTGLDHDGSYTTGTWVRFLPGDAWPADESRPTLIVGRVVERTKTTARLEILAYQTGFRDTDLKFEPYQSTDQPAQSLHAMTKRLTFATDPVQPGTETVNIPLTHVELIQGSEIYGAFDLENASPKHRLASQIKALMTVKGKGEGFTQLQTSTGNVPDSPVLVLLDAPPVPAYQIQIKIVDLPGDQNAQILNLVQHLLNTGLPGAEYIQITTISEPSDVQKTWAALGQTCTDTLEIRLLQEKGKFVMLDQGMRIQAQPWRVVLDTSDPTWAAITAVATAYQMLGYSAASAWVLEQAWHKAKTQDRQAALAPALAFAYHEMERDDWALEIALELEAYAHQANKNTKSILLTAAASIYAIIGRMPEFMPNMKNIQTSLLSAPWLRLLAHAQLAAFDEPGIKELFAATHAKLMRQNAWTEQDEMFSCATRIQDDDDACSQGVSIASTPFSQAWFETHESLKHATHAELLSRADVADQMGAPELALQIWLELLQSGLSPEAAFSVWQNAAAYARKSQQTRRWLYLMAQLARFLENHPMTISNNVFADAVNGWRALDYRSELAALCRIKAQTAAPQEARELRQFAMELYISIGDHENAAAVQSELKN